MNRKHLLFTVLILASMIVSACATATQATTVPTQAPPITAPTQPEPTAVSPQPTNTTAPVAKTVAKLIWTQEFDSLNPLYTNMWFTQVTYQLWNVWAWNYNDKNEPVPVLVTEIPTADNGGISPDTLTITMTLKSGILWSDGTPLTSDDFKFTQEMYTSPKNAVMTVTPYDQVTGVDTPDDTTVVMHFNEPYAPWLARFWHGILPAHILRPVFESDGTLDNAAWNLAPTVGLGPYVFDTWESGSFARFVKNPNYWGTHANIDEIYFTFVPDDASQVAALLAGDGDLGTFIAYSDVPKLKDAGVSIVTVNSGYNEGIYFSFNKEKGNPAIQDVRVRQAIAMAIDRDSINKDLMLGLTKTPASYWDALPFYNNPPVENYSYDPEAAKALLDDAGWVDSNGDEVRDKDGVELIVGYGTTIREVRQSVQAVIQEELAAVGIKVNLYTYESDVFFAPYNENGPTYTGELDFQEWSDSPAGFPDPDIYYWLCSEIPSTENPAGTNSFYLCDEELDALIQLQAKQVNVDERQQTISQINQIFHDKMYWLGLWQDPDVWALGTRLQNVKLSGVTPFYNITEWTITK
jgi:peptide/nickel transport system substrate-binding protein